MGIMKQRIHTNSAPQAIGPYSQAVFVNGTLYTSGQIALDPATGQLVMESLTAETHRVMQNLDGVLQAAGLGFGQVVKTTIFLSDMAHFATVNSIYAGYFGPDDILPARETVQVAGLPKGVNVEISMVAVQ